MSDVQNLWGGYQSDNDPALKVTGGSTVFGLNQKVVLTRFEYSTATGSGGAEGNPALLIEFSIGGGTKNTRVYDPTVPGGKVYYRGKEVLDANSEEYKAGLSEAVKQAKAVVTHYVKASGTPEENVKAAFSAPITSFQQLVTIASGLLSNAIATKKPLDLFLQFQPKIQGSATQTYHDIPTNTAYGAFVTEHMPAVGTWKEERNWEEKDEAGNMIQKTGIRYVDDAGNVHRFQRDETFLKAKVANQQNSNQNAMGGTPTPQTNAAKGAW